MTPEERAALLMNVRYETSHDSYSGRFCRECGYVDLDAAKEIAAAIRAAVEEEREAVILAAYTVCPRGKRCRHFQRFEVAIRARGQR